MGIIVVGEAQSCDCKKCFDYLVNKIKVDYPGYNDKVTEKTKSQLLQLEQDLRMKIKQYPDSCGTYLSTYTSWFKDNHLRIRRVWRNRSEESDSKGNEKYFVGNIDSTLQLTENRDSVVGLWHSFWGDIAIVKSADSESYLGVSISYDRYEKNQIVFSMKQILENEFAVTSYPYYYNFEPEEGEASFRLNKQVLELHDNTRFVKKTNSPIADDAFLYSYFPEFPNGANVYPIALALTDSTFYLRVPSFYDSTAIEFTLKHWDEITSRPNLIIDIRNNGGGQDNYFSTLTDLIYNRPYESKGVEWYASKNNIALFEDALKNGEISNGEEGIEWTNALLEVMRKNVGGFVIHPLMGSDKTIVNDTIYPMPRRIGIIINEGNASSAEQFILEAKNSSKTILFGNCNTAGVLDYSNAVSETLPGGEFELVYPMTRSRRLPEQPIDNVGIAPDVYIPYSSSMQLFDRLDQWVYFVKAYLELMSVEK
jgi:hypothetical protein